MFVPLWLFFLGSGTIMAIGVLVWAVRYHQFEDQDRARYLPLVDLTEEELNRKPRYARSFDYWGLVTILLFNVVAMGLTLFMAIKHL